MQNQKKILLILPAFTYGGTVFSTLNMISYLQKGNYDVNVLAMTHQGPVKEYYKNIKVLPENLILSGLVGRIGKEFSFTRKVLFLFIKLLHHFFGLFNVNIKRYIYRIIAQRIQKNNKYDYVASCQEFDATDFASCFENTKRVAWFRTEFRILNDIVPPKKLKKIKKSYYLFDKIVCVSQTTRDDFCKYFDDIKDKVVAIHNIQNTENIQCKAKEKIDDAFDKSFFNILSVGRIAPQKRFYEIPRIAHELRTRNNLFRWYIIGDATQIEEWDKLQKQIKQYKVSDCVICMGSKLNPYPYIVSADLLVTPSYYEACPRVVIEAKILKVPNVCADFSSAKEFVTNNEDGFVDTIENLSNPISLMISDKNEYKRIKNNCESFKMNNNEIYNQLLNLFS